MHQARETSDFNINIRHFLILALGGNQFLHDTIHRMYEEKKWEYYEEFRKSSFSNDVVMSTYTTISEEKMRQVAGMVEWSYHNNHFTNLYKLIKKGYKYAYQYVQQRRAVDIDDFVLSFIKKRGGEDNVTDSELFFNNIIVLYLCYRENKPCELRNVSGHIFQQGVKDTYNNCFIKEVNFNKEQLEQKKEEISNLYEDYPVPSKYDDLMNVSRLFEYAIGRKTEEIGYRDQLIDPIEARSRAFKEPYLKEVGAFSGWVKTLGINEMDLTSLVPFSKDDMDHIFMEFLIAKEQNNITEEQRDMFIVACIWIQALTHHYKKSKSLYLDDSKEAFYTEVKKREEIVIEKEKELAKKEEDWLTASKKQEEKIKKLEEALRNTELRVKEEQKKTSDLTDYSKEVHALRTYIYEKEENHIESTEMTMKEVAEELEGYRMAIFGGHPKWQNKIKQTLPSITFINVSEMNKDLSYIDRLDAIFINTTFFNHSFYRKLMKRLSKNNTKLFYLDEKSNNERVVMKIFKSLQK